MICDLPPAVFDEINNRFALVECPRDMKCLNAQDYAVLFVVLRLVHRDPVTGWARRCDPTTFNQIYGKGAYRKWLEDERRRTIYLSCFPGARWVSHTDWNTEARRI